MNKNILTTILVILVIIILTGLLVGDRFTNTQTPDEAARMQEQPTVDTLALDTAHKLTQQALPERDVLQNDRPSRYTFTYYDDEEATEDLVEDESVPMVKRMPKETTTPPIYGRDCMTAVDPLDCSQRRLDQYLNQILLENGHSGNYGDTLLINFTVAENGAINGPITITGKTDCGDCKELIKGAVSGMEVWSGAIKAGQAVKVKIKLPITI